MLYKDKNAIEFFFSLRVLQPRDNLSYVYSLTNVIYEPIVSKTKKTIHKQGRKGIKNSHDDIQRI